MVYKKTKDSREVQDHRRNEDILEKVDMDPIETK